MGPVLFVGLSVLALVSQGQGDPTFANPKLTMKGVEFANVPSDVRYTMAVSPPVAWPLLATAPRIAVPRAAAGQQIGNAPAADTVVVQRPTAQDEIQSSSQMAEAGASPDPVASITPVPAAVEIVPQRANVEDASRGREHLLIQDAAQRPAVQRDLRQSGDTVAEPELVDPLLPSVASDVDRTPNLAGGIAQDAANLRPDRRPEPASALPEPDFGAQEPMISDQPAVHALNLVRPQATVAWQPADIGLEPQQDTPDLLTIVADPSARAAIVNGDRVFLRTEPGINGQQIGQFDLGEAAVVTQTRGNWARIVIRDQTGWMYLRYLDFE